MTFQKTSALLVLPTLFLLGCDSMSHLDYNKAVIEDVEALSEAVDVTLNSYDMQVPVSVNAETVVDVAEMETALSEAKQHLNVIHQETLFFKSFDKKQSESVSASLELYSSVTGEYLDSYSEMIAYYSDDFSADIDQVIVFDDELFILYNNHVDAHNDLADTLDQF